MLNNLKQILLFLLGVPFLALTSCEDEISPALEPADPILVVDAWLNNKPETQHIRLMVTQSYFDNTTPPPVSGATIAVSDDEGKVYNFSESATQGDYIWTPVSGESFGSIGRKYKLSINVNGEEYESYSSMGRVPVIDSLTLTFEEENAFQLDSYIAEFWSTESPGPNDTYWIKAWKNGVLLNKPNEINLAYDAGFSAGGNFDGVTFITPKRRGINSFETDDNTGKALSPYEPGDSVHVEIHSITLQAFNFMNEVIIQTDRPGGFSELFATPLSNVSTNIVNVTDKNKQVLGFFNTAAVSQIGRRFEE